MKKQENWYEDVSKFNCKRKLSKPYSSQAISDTDPSEITGISDTHDTIRHMLADLKRWSEGSVPWSDITASAIIEGEPGSGKTHLAKQIAKCLGDGRAIITSYAEWQAAGHLGDFLQAMEQSFTKAKEQRPSLLFIDEIDSFGTRGSRSSNGSYDRKSINGFLAHLNMDDLEGVIVIGACNDASGIDPAIRRQGRFDMTLHMEPPRPDMIAEMIKGQLGPDVLEDEITDLAKMLTGISPAKIMGTIRKVKSYARHNQKTFSCADILKEALPPEKIRSTIWRRVAAHESGHAIVSAALERSHAKSLMMRSDGSGVFTSKTILKEGRLEDYEAEISAILAGRVAEDMIMGDVSSGAGGSRQSDLAKATKLALMIECQFGLGSKLSFSEIEEDWKEDKTLSKLVEMHLIDGQSRAAKILEHNADLLSEMTDALIAERYISGDSLDTWLSNLKSLPSKGDTIAPRATPMSVVNLFLQTSCKFKQKETGRAEPGVSSALSVLLLRHMTIIGWRYGARRCVENGDYLNPDVITACAEGLRIVTKDLPKNAVINVEYLEDYANFLWCEHMDFTRLKVMGHVSIDAELAKITKEAQAYLRRQKFVHP